MPIDTLLLYALAALLTIVTPGPTMLLALANGSRHGVRSAWAGVAGAVTSDLLLIGAVALGLGALLAASETAFQVLKWLGVAYLAFLGLSLLWRHQPAATPADAEPTLPPDASAARRLFAKSLLVALSNPKGYLFFSALLPQFIVPDQAQAPQYLVLAAVFALIDALAILGYAWLGAQGVRRLGHQAQAWIDRGSGAALLLLAAGLASYRRASI